MGDWWELGAAAGVGAILGAVLAGGGATEAYNDGHADGYAWGRYTAREGRALDRVALARSASRGGPMSRTARELLGGGR